MFFSELPAETHRRHSNHERERTHLNNHERNAWGSHAYNVDIGGNHQHYVHLLNNESLKYCPKEPNFTYVIDKQMQQYTCQKPVFINGRLVAGEYNEGNVILSI